MILGTHGGAGPKPGDPRLRRESPFRPASSVARVLATATLPCVLVPAPACVPKDAFSMTRLGHTR